MYAALEQGGDGPDNRWFQLEKLTSVRPADLGNRTRLAKVGSPTLAVRSEQTALLHIAAAEVITVEMRAFNASRSFHVGNYRTQI